MARSIERHVTPDEIELLLASREPALKRADGVDQDEIQFHLSDCHDCRDLLAKHAAVAGQFMQLQGNSHDGRGPDCPTAEKWMLLATGLLPNADAVTCAEHAAACDYCGPLLREATEDFAEDSSPEDDALIAGLQTSQRRGRRDLAARLSALSGGDREQQSRLRWPSLALWPRFAFPIAALALVVFFVSRMVTPHASPESTAERLIAQAYTQERTIDLRFPGAAYAPMRTERGSATSRVNRPGALLDAEALVARNLAAHPSDPEWLAAKGRIDLLEWNSDSAMKSLKQALDLQPDSALIKSDLASAYFQRAETTNQSIDYGTAAEWYGRALAQDPNNPIALFNRAITYERLFLYDQALEDWQHYLQVDPKGEWVAEARSRLNALKQKMKDRNSSAITLPNDAGSALASLSDLANTNHSDSEPGEKTSEEDYLPIALTRWLPSVYNGPPSSQSDDPAKKALAVLAHLLRSRHGDEWLSDFLSVTASPSANEGVRDLVTAIQANVNGNTEEAERSATQAESHFHAAGNLAGELRSRFEFVYALKRAQRGHACLDAANRLVADLGSRNYRWLRTQGLLEQSNCLYMVGQLQLAVVRTSSAIREAQTAGYNTLYLRALGMAASWQTAKGDTAAAWQLDCRGLSQYWAGHYDGLRAWQFYDDMGYGPRESSEWYLAVALGREAVSAVAVAGRPAEEAQARFRLATVAASAGRATEAAAEFEKAKRIYHQLPRSASVRAFEANGEIALAELEYGSGQYDRALARLAAVHTELPHLESYTFPLRYYVTLGKLHLQRGDVDQAEADLHAAVLITEVGLRSLADQSNRLTWERETGEVYRLLVRLLLLDRKDEVGALRVWEWYRAAALRRDASQVATQHNVHSRLLPEEIPFSKLDSNPDLPPMQEFDQAVPGLKNQTVISYAWLNDGLAIWIFDSRAIHAQWVGLSEASVERVARRFTENCADSATSIDAIDRDGSELYKWLLRPVAGFLSPDRMIVVEADGPIALIPFQALKTNDGKYLGADWAVLVSPGINFSTMHRGAQHTMPQDGALVVGMPNVKGELAYGLPALPDAGAETEMVAQHFRQKTVLVGREATRDAVLLHLAHASVFHFAGHALSGAPRRGLLLAGNGASTSDSADNAVLLDAETLGQTAMSQCWLAVLSACSTANGEDVMIDPEDLAGAFLRAGVANVVASRWNVDSAVTRLFMGRFYSRLQAGNTVPQALKNAAAEIRNNPRTSHPHYWAAFSSFGRT